MRSWTCTVSFVGLKADELLELAEQLSLYEVSSDFYMVVISRCSGLKGTVETEPKATIITLYIRFCFPSYASKEEDVSISG